MKSFLLIVGLCFLTACNLQGKGSLFDEKASARWVVWSEQPAEAWEDAFVTGNGQQGTMVLGTPTDERIICVHEELFIRGWDYRKETVPHTASLMPEVRRLLAEGKNYESSALIADEADRQLREMGAKQRWPLIPHPAFDLRVRYVDMSDTISSRYRRSLDLETGEATVLFDGDEGVVENVFSSRTDGVDVIRLLAGKQGKLNLCLDLEETPGREGWHFEHNLDSAFTAVKVGADPGWLTYRAVYANNSDCYEGVAKVTVKGGEMAVEGSGLKIEGADEVLVVVRITPLDGRETTRQAEVKEELSALSTDYQKLLAAHSREHGAMFRRMQLDLGCAEEWKTTSTERMLEVVAQRGVTPLFMEQTHAMGRYLLISSCGKYPPPLQGIWGGSWKPAWIGGFVWDSNINLAISAASMSNLPECAESYCSYVERLLPGWRLNAKNYLGCRGFIVAHYNDPENGYLTHFGASFPWMCWPGGAGWNLRPFYEYAMLMGDDKMLKERVLPLYRQMADFYEDFLVMGSDSLFHIVPSVSPENAPNGNYTWFSRDATMDVAIAREVFEVLLSMGKQFQLPETEQAKWRYYLERFPEYRINADGALAEWVDSTYKDVYNHRHLSHLYPVFPGSQIGKYKGAKRLIEAAKVALDKRYAFDTSSAHGLIHVALQAARLGDLEKVMNNLDRFSRRKYVYNGLVTSHEPNRLIYNLDAILSLPRLFMEMLVYTEPGKVELLPAWPESYADGSLNGIRIFGGHTLNIAWSNGKLKRAVLHAGKDGEYEVSYGNKRCKLQLCKGKSYELDTLL